jgi:eukaryotic-like serine/threonine-protein kinase
LAENHDLGIDRIGRYRIESCLGKGGMGDVYLGYDETLERKVALKCIKAENRLDEEAKARFLREAKVLSQLGHPDICQIYDYIEGEDADYLVLELISGRKLGNVIEENKLSTRRKLLVARRIANVLALAHEKGIVHRDLKPDNVILTDDDGVKVLDFGLARQLFAAETDHKSSDKAIERNISTDKTIALSGSGVKDSTLGLTTVGLVMGTLGYMSPEQARGEDVTPLSDMYSLGVLVEELFSGRSSFDNSLSFDSLLAKNQSGERQIAIFEDSDLSELIKDLTALEPQARLTARETYQRLSFILEKPIRKRKRILVSAVITVLAVFAMVATVFWIKALKAEKRAREEAEAAKQVSDFLVGLFEVSDPSEAKGNSVTAREVLEKGSEKVESELSSQPKIQSRLMLTMGQVFINLGLYKEAKSLLEKSFELRKRTYGNDADETAEILNEMGKVNEIEGNYKEAMQFYKSSLDIRKKIHGEFNSDVAYCMNNLATIYTLEGDYDKAKELLTRSYEIRLKVSGSNHPDVALALNNLADLMNKVGKYEEAEQYYRNALKIWKESYGEMHPDVAACLTNLALLCKKQNKFDEAEQYYSQSLSIKEKVYGPDHPAVATTLNNMGAFYFAQKKYDKAEENWLKVYRIYSDKFGPDHPNLGIICNNLALVYKARKDYPKALDYYTKALSIFEKKSGRDSLDVGKTLNNVANLYISLGNFKDAESSYLEAIEITEKKLGRVHPVTVGFKMNLYELYYEQKDYARAEKALLSTLSQVQADKNSKPSEIKKVLEFVIGFYDARGDKDKAEKYSRMMPAK